MRGDSKVNPFEAKRIARQKYAERQIEKFVNGAGKLKARLDMQI